MNIWRIPDWCPPLIWKEPSQSPEVLQISLLQTFRKSLKTSPDFYDGEFLFLVLIGFSWVVFMHRDFYVNHLELATGMERHGLHLLKSIKLRQGSKCCKWIKNLETGASQLQQCTLNQNRLWEQMWREGLMKARGCMERQAFQEQVFLGKTIMC